MKKGGLKTPGFTIVEMLIVLAVTGGLFVAIAATLAGRQNTAQFNHAVQSIQDQIQQVINQTEAGFFPDTSNFTCTDIAGTVQITAGASPQGTNQDCVFFGKVIQFGVQGTSPEQYRVYSVAGIRKATVGATSPFQTASPTIVGVSYAGSDAGLLDYSTPGSLQYGLTTLWVRSNNNSGCTSAACSLGAVGFLMEPGSLSAATGTYNSGAQQVDLIPIANTQLAQNLHNTANATNTSLRNTNLTTVAPINPSLGVQICFVSGGTNQSGLLTIGSSGRQLLVKLDIKGNKTCS
jgi:type II secretory pathway pseudopilin PulG